MPRRSKIDLLDPDVKAWLDQELIRRGFSGYEELEDLLDAQGLKIGKSIIHRYGQKLETQIEAIKASTEAARVVVEAAQDDVDARSEAVMGMLQTGLFNALVDMHAAEDEIDPSAKFALLGKAARGISQLTRASIAQKKHASEVRERLDAAKRRAAEKVEAVAKKAGLSDEDFGLIRAQILGIEVAE